MPISPTVFRPTRRTGRLALVAMVLIIAGCASPDEVRPENVLLIGIDTLRADHLGCYGYARPTSPNIDTLARDGVRFTTAVSQAPWTLPAFASILTGLLPSHHRAGEGNLPYVSGLDATTDTLASILTRHGYRTAAFVSNVWVGRDVGLDRGFETHELAQLPGTAVDQAVRWLSGGPADRFFLFVHIFDPHAPYTPAAEDARPFVATDYAGPFQSVFPTVWRNGIPLMAVDARWSSADRQRIVDLYDAEIHYADRLVGRLLNALASGGFTDDTLVIVLSDHGEELFDHGRLGHAHTLYDELLLVPLVMRFPDPRLRGLITTQVRTMDVFPTVLEALGIPVPPGIDGESLLPSVRERSTTRPPSLAFAESAVQAEDIGLKALRGDGEKVILSPATDRALYFDLNTDPHETRDLASQRPERVEALRRLVEQESPASLDGFHLRAVGHEAHDVHVRLAAEDGIVDVTPLATEEGDRVTTTADGRELDLVFRLRPRASPITAHDVDGVRFRTRGDGPVTFRTATIDGRPFAPGALTLGAGAPNSKPLDGLRIQNGAIVVRHPHRLRIEAKADVALNLQLVRTKDPKPAALDPDTVDRLRALGYAE